MAKWPEGFFMPLDILKGVDSAPESKRKRWYVVPRSIVGFRTHDMGVFIHNLPEEDFPNFEAALKFALNWRKKWLKEQTSL